MAESPSVIAELSESMYRRYVDESDLAVIDALDMPDRVYFWTSLWYQIPRRLDRSWLSELQDHVSRTVRMDGEESATPFRDAEDAMLSHSWFSSRRIVR